MKAAILTELKKPLILDDIQLPDKLEYGQVLVKVVCSGICGSQLGEMNGVKGPDKYLPHLLGHEGGGIVEKIGPGVSKVAVGDHVVMHWRKGTGIDAQTPKYKWGDQFVNAGWVTTFNELAIVSENRLTTIPKDIDFEIAALFGCAVTTGLGVVNNDAQLKIGESIAVFGSGSVGLNIIQGADLVSAYPIIAIDLYDHKLQLAKQFGATHVINSSKSDVSEEIKKIVGNSGVDVVIDNTGNVEVIALAYELTSQKGRTILVGVPPASERASFYTLPLHFDKKIVGSHGGRCNPSVDIPNYLKMVSLSKMRIKEMITHRFKFNEINTALSQLKQGLTGKSVVEICS